MIKPVEINLNLRPASLYTRISAQIVRAVPSKYLPIINSAADVVGRIMTSRPIEYRMMTLFGRAYDLGRARRLAGSGGALSSFSWADYSKNDREAAPFTTRPFSFDTINRPFGGSDYKFIPLEWRSERLAADIIERQRFAKFIGDGTGAKPKNESCNWPSRWREGIAQMKIDRFPPLIQGLIERLFKRTAERAPGQRYEYIGIAIELPDGTIVAQKFEGTSESVDSVSAKNALKGVKHRVFAEAASMMKQRKLYDGAIKIYLLHTHPQTPEEPEIGVSVSDNSHQAIISIPDMFSSDGRAVGDVQRIRKAGFKGNIEVVEGAIPVPFSQTEADKSKLFVCTYTRVIRPQEKVSDLL